MSPVMTVCGLISRCRLRDMYRVRSQVSSCQIRKHGNSARRPGSWSCAGGVSLPAGPEAGAGGVVSGCAWLVPTLALAPVTVSCVRADQLQRVADRDDREPEARTQAGFRRAMR